MKVIIIILTITTIFSVITAVFKTDTTYNFQQILPEGTVEIGFLIAFLGWMPAPLDVSIWQSLWAIEKKKEVKEFDTKKSILDFNIGYIATFVLGICFLGLGAIVMHNSGENFNPKASVFAQQLIGMYTNTIGNSMYIIIGIAAFTTMFSTTLTTLDASPRAMTRTVQLLSKKSPKKLYWIWIVFLAAGTLIILKYFIDDMGTLIRIATILSFLTAPFYAIINYSLISGKHTPKEWRPSTMMKIWSYLGIIFLVGFSVWYHMNL